MSSERILYIDPLPSDEAFKTYYILKGACFVFEDSSTAIAGDLIVFKNTEEIQTLKTLEETIILVHATNYDLFKSVENFNEKVSKLLTEIQNKDHYTGEHSQRVYELVKKLALKLGYQSRALNNITKAAYYHDLGKIFICDEILNKPDTLSHDEFEEIKRHVLYSKEMILENYNVDIYTIILEHHERYNGSGYPNGLKADEISKEARIIAVCDSFDAMITDRVYKKGKSVEIVAAFTEMILELWQKKIDYNSKEFKSKLKS